MNFPLKLRSAQEASLFAAAHTNQEKYLDPRIIQAIDKAVHGGQYSVLLEDNWLMRDYHYVKQTLQSSGYIVTSEKTGMNESQMKVSWPHQSKIDANTIWPLETERVLTVEEQYTSYRQQVHNEMKSLMALTIPISTNGSEISREELHRIGAGNRVRSMLLEQLKTSARKLGLTL